VGASRAQDLIFLSGGQCLAQGREGIIGPEQILYSAAPPRRQWILDVRAADLQEEMAEQRFSVPSAPTKTAATQRTSPRAAASNQTQREQQAQRNLRQSSKMGACVAAEQQHHC
jgi:hypothetical protein